MNDLGGIAVKTFMLVSVILLCVCVLGSTIELREWEVWNQSELWNAIWCSVTVRNERGDFITNLRAEDFIMTETIYDAEEREIATRRVVFNNKFYQFNGQGFWEESVNSEKLDIVFLIDNTGSMKKHIEDIKAELKEFLARLYENKTDFRIVIAEYEINNEPEWAYPNLDKPARRFYGPLMKDEIEDQVNSIWAAHESWYLQWGYDAFLWTLNLDWRKDAKKIVVVITDVLTDSVHGPNWSYDSGCITSPFAVHLAMTERNIHLYYCQPKEDQMMKTTELRENYSEKVNPLVKKMNFDFLLKINPLTKKLSWPFDQNEIELSQSAVVESKYYFAWVSDFSNLSSTQKKSAKKVVVSIRRFGEQNATTFEFYPVKNPEGRLAKRTTSLIVHLTDEAGNPLENEDVGMRLYKSLGNAGRVDSVSADHYQQNDQNSTVRFRSVPLGKYFYIIKSYSTFSGYYNQIGYYSTGWITVDSDEPMELNLAAQTIYKEVSIYRLRGLVEEFKNMEIATQDLIAMVVEVENWLDRLLSDGSIDNAELEATIRMSFGLGVLVNCSQYAIVEFERSVEDITQITQKVVNMISKAKEIVEELNQAKDLMISASRTFLDILTANWSGAAAKVTVEFLVQKVVSYVENELLDDVIDAVLDKLVETMFDPEELVAYMNQSIRKGAEQGSQLAEQQKEHANFVQNSLITPIFVELINNEIGELLKAGDEFLNGSYAKPFNLSERSSAMKTTFRQFTTQHMQELYRDACRHLRDQKSLDNWQNTLTVLSETLPLITEFLKLFEFEYPEFKPLRQTLETLYEVFDDIRALTTTYELALKINHLRSMLPIVKSVADSSFAK